MKKKFIIFSQLREEIKNLESRIPLAPPQKQAGKGIHLKSPCGCTSPPRTGAGRKPGEASLHCDSCNQFIRWVSVSSLTRVAEGGEV